LGKELAPSFLKPYVAKITPVLLAIGKLINVAAPHVQKFVKYLGHLHQKLAPFHPHLLAQMFFGIVLMFFGGFFMTLIACIEAFRLTGYTPIMKALQLLWADYKKVKAASDKDDEEDLDGDGVPDVQQISAKDLASRKILVFLKSCDPTKISEATGGLYVGLVGVLATLKLQFARTITLGATIGEIISKPAIKFGHPILCAVVPVDYQRWIDVIIMYICKSIGVSIAWNLQRIISSVHSAMRGAQMFTEAFAEFTAAFGYMALSRGYWDEAFAVVCALGGFYLQINSWFSLPWILWFPLLPLVILEKVLMYTVALST